MSVAVQLMGKHRKSKARPDAESGQKPYGQSAAVRTAWIIGAIVVALYVLSLVQGHRGDMQSSWEPNPPTRIAPAPSRAGAPAPNQNAPAPAANHPPSVSQP